MFRKKEVSGPRVEQSVAKAVSYEVTVADMARKSERRAWIVAGSSLVMSLILVGGYFYILPLKEKVPFLVMADAYTGTATVARLTGSFQGQQITTNEAVNRSNVAQYVLARESFDSQLMGLRDWALVFLMSEDSVAASYDQLYGRTNPANPLTLYGRERAVRVKILSITPLDVQPNGGFNGASVRIQRSLFDKKTGTSKFLDSKIITMRFIYRNDIAFSEEDRVINPLGFRVSEYRVDTDYAKGVPTPDTSPEVEETQQTPIQPPVQSPDAALPSDNQMNDQLPAIGLNTPPAAAPVETGTQEQISIGRAEGASNR
ncbi:type IV secretion system protein VirB8 [Xanthomonas arboricola]|uniref:virB8 family protein n=1 Tax=Xanthomonas campestris TaxID=339 RepID=UPI002169585A|nr:type IV secretion system protein [Xanthomonas campestris]MCS3848989.1 type IV secretion system protein VirB8 [Xanthomonas campestris]MCW2005000.1 type IV secretion system protein VirB8 [Xanthomonas campestris]